PAGLGSGFPSYLAPPDLPVVLREVEYQPDVYVAARAVPRVLLRAVQRDEPVLVPADRAVGGRQRHERAGPPVHPAVRQDVGGGLLDHRQARLAATGHAVAEAEPAARDLPA